MSLLSKLAQKGLGAALSGQAGDARAPVKGADVPRTAAAPANDPAEARTHALMIACPDPTQEDRARDTHRLRGQRLARQEMWKDLSRELRAADRARKATPGAMALAELLSYGARSDVVLAAEHALLDGRPEHDAPLLSGIEAFEEMLSEMRDDPMCAVMVAQTHMDLGWAWRGTGRAARVRERNREAFEAHFDRACDILDGIEHACTDSPFFLRAKCALNGAGIYPASQIARDYERLIDLDPSDPAPMRALGTYLSPRWYGSHEELERQARRIAGRTHSHWGAGGYAWVMFDTLANDEDACAILDTGFFIEGLHDIVHRLPDQHTVNLLAAFCAHTMSMPPTGNAQSDAARAEIAACAGWIVRTHMTELHPLIWAHAAAGFANNLNVASPRHFAAMGQRDALKVIARLFQREIAQGRRIIFTADGPVAEIF